MRCQMSIINFSNKCKGKWTWIGRDKKSIINYALIDVDGEYLIKNMIIYDGVENWDIGSDHSWMEITLLVPLQKVVPHKKSMK